jgi:hypothetical protein
VCNAIPFIRQKRRGNLLVLMPVESNTKTAKSQDSLMLAVAADVMQALKVGVKMSFIAHAPARA